MANNLLIEGFATSHAGDLHRRLSDAFDSVLSASDEAAATRLKSELDTLLQERIIAHSQNQA